MVKKNQIPVSPSILKYAKLSTQMKSKGREPTVRDSPKITNQSHGSNPLQIPSSEDMDTIAAPTNERTPNKPIVTVTRVPSAMKRRSVVVVEGVRKKIRISTDHPDRFYKAVVRCLEKESSSPISTSSFEVSPNNVGSYIKESRDRKDPVPSIKKCQLKGKTSHSLNQRAVKKIESIGHPIPGCSKAIRGNPSSSRPSKTNANPNDSVPHVTMQSSLGAIGHYYVKAKSADIFGNQSESSDEESEPDERSIGSEDSEWSKNTGEVVNSNDDSDEENSDTDEDDDTEESDTLYETDPEDESPQGTLNLDTTQSKSTNAEDEKYNDKDFGLSYERDTDVIERNIKTYTCKLKGEGKPVCGYSTTWVSSMLQHLKSKRHFHRRENANMETVKDVCDITHHKEDRPTNVYVCKLVSPKPAHRGAMCRSRVWSITDARRHFDSVHANKPRRGTKLSKEEASAIGRKAANYGLQAEIEAIPLIADYFKIPLDSIQHVAKTRFNITNENGELLQKAVMCDYIIDVDGEQMLGELKSTPSFSTAKGMFEKVRCEVYTVNEKGEDVVNSNHRYYRQLVRELHHSPVYKKIALFSKTLGLDGKGDFHVAFLYKNEKTQTAFNAMMAKHQK